MATACSSFALPTSSRRAKGWNYDQEGSSDPHPIIPIRPVKIHYTPNYYSCYIHTYTHHAILLGCPWAAFGGLATFEASRPIGFRNFWNSKSKKFRNQIGIEATKLRPGAKKKFWPCTSLGGVHKNGQHAPLWRGQCCGCAGTCPRRPTKNWAASPPFAGG